MLFPHWPWVTQSMTGDPKLGLVAISEVLMVVGLVDCPLRLPSRFQRECQAVELTAVVHLLHALPSTSCARLRASYHHNAHFKLATHPNTAQVV